MTRTSGERGTSFFVVSLRRPASSGTPQWRCWVRHVASGSDALVVDIGGLANFMDSCLGTSAFKEEADSPLERRVELEKGSENATI